MPGISPYHLDKKLRTFAYDQRSTTRNATRQGLDVRRVCAEDIESGSAWMFMFPSLLPERGLRGEGDIRRR